jgi:hypothetical protein
MKLTLFLSAFILCSCSMLGTWSKIHHAPTRPLRNVAVLIASDNVFADGAIDGHIFLFTKSVAEELSDRKLFKYKILDKKYSIQALNDLETSLLGVELREQYDAILICSPRAQFNSNRVVMRLYQTEPAFEIVHVSHSTHLGNSYWFAQTGEGMLIDATHGAMDRLQQTLEKFGGE